MTATRKAGARLRRIHRWAVALAVVLVLAATGLWVLASGLTRLAPVWWRSSVADEPRTRALAERIENDVANAMYRATAGQVWSVGLRAPDANAWLNTRLGAWLANQDERFRWPERVRDVQVEFAEDRVHVGVEVVGGDGSQILSARLRPELGADGALWVRAESVYVGRLPLPAAWVLEGSGASSGLPPGLLAHPEADRLFNALTGRAPAHPNPVLELGDGRVVRLIAVEAAESMLRLTFRTEHEP